MTLRDQSGGWNVWWWGWEERKQRRERDHIEERSNCQPPGPQDYGARQHDSWPMGYLTKGRRSNSRTEILLMLLPVAMHQVVLSVTHQKYPSNLLWMELFRDAFQCVLKAKPKRLYNAVNDTGKWGLWVREQNFMQNVHANTHRGTAGFPVELQKKLGREFKRDNLPQFECVSLLVCGFTFWLHTILFPPHSSHGKLSLFTCCLIPLLAAGQQVNRSPPPRHRRGSTLMKRDLGAACFGRLHARGNDILGSPGPPHLAASIFPWLLPHADQAQSIQHILAGMQTHTHSVEVQTHRTHRHTHTHRGVKVCVNAHAQSEAYPHV